MGSAFSSFQERRKTRVELKRYIYINFKSYKGGYPPQQDMQCMQYAARNPFCIRSLESIWKEEWKVD